MTVRTYALETWIKNRQTDDLDWKNDRGRLLHHQDHPAARDARRDARGVEALGVAGDVR